MKPQAHLAIRSLTDFAVLIDCRRRFARALLDNNGGVGLGILFPSRFMTDPFLVDQPRLTQFARSLS